MSRTFQLEIEFGNDAMKTAFDVSRALVQIANVLRKQRRFVPGAVTRVRDDNGNTVGEWQVRERP